MQFPYFVLSQCKLVLAHIVVCNIWLLWINGFNDDSQNYEVYYKWTDDKAQRSVRDSSNLKHKLL